MKSVYKNLLITTVCSIGIGALAIVPIVTSDNGYVAGFIVIPLLILVCAIALILFIAGLTTITKKVGPYLLLSSALLPLGFFGTAMTSKYFEFGAYREDPIRPIIPPIANKVIFKADATHEEVQNFWKEVLSIPTGESGEYTRPGIQSISSSLPENGREVVLFSFFENATDAQKADIRTRIEAYNPVDQYLENVDTTQQETPPPAENKDSAPKKDREPTSYRYSQ